MARATKQAAAASTALAPTSRQTALEPWEEELAAEAVKAKGQVAGVGGGSFVSIKGGKLSIGGNAIPNNEIAVVVVASAAAKTYYSKAYNPKEPGKEPPTCYALADSFDADMAPHADCEEKQSDACQGCPKNEFGTARVGNGKACRDAFRLALVDAGTLDDGAFTASKDAKKFERGEAAILSVPPTSLKAWASYARSIADISKRPPYAVFTRISVEMDPSETYPVVSFNCLGMVPKDLIPVLRQRSTTAGPTLTMPFPKREAGKVAEQPRKPGKTKY